MRSVSCVISKESNTLVGRHVESALLNYKRKAANNIHHLLLLKRMDQTIIVMQKEAHGEIVIGIIVRPRIMGDAVKILQGKEIDDADLIVGIILEEVVEVEGIGSGGAGAEVVIAAISFETTEPGEEGKDEILSYYNNNNAL